jgi:hypothetical protein
MAYRCAMADELVYRLFIIAIGVVPVALAAALLFTK